MANIKFSAFSAGGSVDTSTARIVGFKHLDTSANYYYTIADLATMLSPSISTIYAADGTIGTTRKALITDTIQFRDSGDTADVLSLNTDGTFTLGLAAVTTGTNTITIGDSANTYSHSKNIAIGYSADASASLAIAIGSDAQSTAGSAVSIGNLSQSGTTAGVAIGYASIVGVGATYGIAVGGNTTTSGANSITLNSNSGAVDNTTANTFGIYMTSNTAADFAIVGGGESTLNTSLKITGQGYTELHTGTTPVDPDWNNGNIQESTLLSGSNDFDPSNPKAGATYILKLTQPGTADGTVNWDNIGAANIKWPGGTEPTLTASAAAVDIITLICTDATGQGVYYASATLDMQ